MISNTDCCRWRCTPPIWVPEDLGVAALAMPTERPTLALSGHRMVTSGAGKGDIGRHKATPLLDKHPVQEDNPA